MKTRTIAAIMLSARLLSIVALSVVAMYESLSSRPHAATLAMLCSLLSINLLMHEKDMFTAIDKEEE